MPDLHLRDRESMHERKRREEPVHALEERDAFQHWTPEYFERAAGIVDAVVCIEIPHTIGDARREHFDQTVLSGESPPAHDIVGVCVGHKFQDVFAVLLKIAVDCDDQFSGRLLKARVECAGLSVISVEMERGNLGVLRGQPIHDLAAAVAAAVVHKDNLIGARP